MRPVPLKSSVIALAAALALAPLGGASAQQYRGIMIAEGGPAAKKRAKKPPKKHAEQPRRRPRGSSTYIPPPIPSPNTGPATVAPASPGVYQPPKIKSHGDRVGDCIHSFPLNRGIGNNPNEQQAYIRQCAN